MKQIPKGGFTPDVMIEVEERIIAEQGDAAAFFAHAQMLSLNRRLEDIERKERIARATPEGDVNYQRAQRMLKLIDVARNQFDSGRGVAFHQSVADIQTLANICNSWILGPHAERGNKILQSAHDGHARTHGTPDAKAKRWAEQRAAYRAARDGGHSKKSAKSIAAEQCDVSIRTIERAFKQVGESIP